MNFPTSLKTPLLILLNALFCLSPIVRAQTPPKLSGVEKYTARRVVYLAHKVARSDFTGTLASNLNQADVGADNVAYENFQYCGVDRIASMTDFFHWTWRLFDTGKARKDANLGGLAYTNRVDGIHDYVDIGTDLIEGIMNGTGVDRACAEMRFAALIIGETVKRFQDLPLTANDTQRCDAERDALCMSIMFLDSLIDDLESAPGVPHATLAAVDNSCLRTRLQQLGLSDADVAAYHSCMTAHRMCLQDRKALYFDNNLASGISWLSYYATIKSPLFLCESIASDRLSVTLTHPIGASKTYPAPAGHDIVNVSKFKNTNGKWTLVILSQNLNFIAPITFPGNLFATTYVDVNCDGLPDCVPASGPISLGLTFAPAARDLYSVPVWAVEGTVSAGGDLAVVVDSQIGNLYTLEIATNGSIGAHESISGEPLLTGGVFIAAARRVGASDLRITLTDNPTGGGGTLAHTFQGPINGSFSHLSSLNTLALGRSPTEPVNFAALEVGSLAPVQVQGNPGDTVTLTSQANGTVIASGVIGSDGTATLNPVIAAGANTVVRATDGVQTQDLFSPVEGVAVTCAGQDETGDGLMDRMDVTVEPARMHVSGGLPGGLFTPLVEQALEIEPGPITEWTGSTRTIAGVDGDLQLIPMAGQPAPVFIQSLADFDQDGTADETVIVSRPAGAASFSVQLFSQATSAGPVLDDQIMLPPGFSPLIVVHNLGSSGGDGITIPGVNGGFAQIAIANGQLVMTAVCNGPCQGQAPQPGLAVMDINNAITVTGAPVSSGIAGPYFATAVTDGPFTFTFEGQPNASIVCFMGPLNPGVVVLPGFGQIDLGTLNGGGGIDNLTIIGNGIDGGSFFDSFFRVGPQGTTTLSLLVPTNLSGMSFSFQSLITGGVFGLGFSNAVCVTIQ